MNSSVGKSDVIQMHVRAYTTIPAEPQEQQPRDKQRRRQNGDESDDRLTRMRDDIKGPWDGVYFVFDPETTTDERQDPRFGFYRIYGLDKIERDLFLTRWVDEWEAAKASNDEEMLTYIADQYSAICDRLIEEGIVYNEATLSEAEVVLLKRYARVRGLHDLPLRADPAEKEAYRVTRLAAKQRYQPQDFIDLFYEQVYRQVYEENGRKRFYGHGALYVGLNLPFDLSRLAVEWRRGGGDFPDGFTFRLCTCEVGGKRPDICFRHPPLRIRAIARHKAFIRFSHVTPFSADGRPLDAQQYEGRFLDVATLGGALFGAGVDHSLNGLLRALGIDERKDDTDEHGGLLTERYLDYARKDVALTALVYQRLRDLYRQHGLSTEMVKLYSAASLGKAYLREMGIEPPGKRLNLPDEETGKLMTALYAGRSEVAIRHTPVEVEYADFKQEYVTVNALLGTQEMLLAERLSIDDVTVEIRDLLASLTVDSLLDFLHDPGSWKLLRVICLIQPSGDRLPIRANYGGDGLNLALPLIESGPACYWTLADMLGSFLRTGKAPQVVEARRYTPHGSVAAQTRALDFFGNPAYRMDPATDDIFIRMGDLRSRVKRDMKQARAAGNKVEETRLKAIQAGIKEVGNATSYGVNIEINEEAETVKPKKITVFGLSSSEKATQRIETPGKYFFAPIGVFVPAGGRLLLAIAETLGKREGLSYAFMDTDSIAFARLDGMAHEEFYERCARVRDWFTALSPYEGQPPLLECEDENYWPNGSQEREPLYFLGVSAKRYVIFNKPGDGTYHMRKFSSHGLGTYARMRGGESSPDIPPPWTPDSEGHPDSYQLGGARWSYDLWYDFIVACETGHYRSGEPVPRNADGGLEYSVQAAKTLTRWDPPAFHQLTISTWDLYRQYSSDQMGVIEALRPYSFITLLPPFSPQQSFLRLNTAAGVNNEGPLRPMTDEQVAREQQARTFFDAYIAAGCPAFFTAYAPTVEALERAHQEGRIYTRIGERAVALPPSIPLMTLAETLDGYFAHPEAKAARPRGAGDVGVRSVVVSSDIVLGGKETNSRAMMAAEQTDKVVGGDRAEEMQVYGIDGLALAGREYTTLFKKPDGKLHTYADLMLVTGIPRRTVEDIAGGKTKKPHAATLKRLFDGLPLLDPANPDTILGWRDEVPNTTLALALRHVRGNADEGPLSEDEMVFIREVKKGKRHLPDQKRLALIAAIQQYQREQREDDGSPTAAETDAQAYLKSIWSQEQTPTEPPVSRGVQTFTLDEIVRQEEARMREQGVL
jgi:hypothetical protein